MTAEPRPPVDLAAWAAGPEPEPMTDEWWAWIRARAMPGWEARVRRTRWGYSASYTNGLLGMDGGDWAWSQRGIVRKVQRRLARLRARDEGREWTLR